MKEKEGKELITSMLNLSNDVTVENLLKLYNSCVLYCTSCGKNNDDDIKDVYKRIYEHAYCEKKHLAVIHTVKKHVKETIKSIDNIKSGDK